MLEALILCFTLATYPPTTHGWFATLQLIAASRMDQKLHMRLPQDAAALDSGAPAPGTSRPSSAASSKSSKVTLIPVYPHMYAVEVGKPNWLSDMITSAEACFLADARMEAPKKGQRSDAEMARRVAGVTSRKKSDWINIQIGATNPPTPLFRSGFGAVL